MITCQEIEELAPFYVARALDHQNTAEIEAHLASCRRHEQTISELKSAAAGTGPIAEMRPSPEVKQRLMAAVRETAQPVASRRPWLALRHPLTLATTAAVLILLVVAAVLWTLDRRSSDEDGVFAISLAGDDQASATLFYVRGEKRGVILTDGLPVLPQGMTYQVWAIHEDDARSCGLIDVASGTEAFGRMDGAVYRNQRVIVTIEPSGGSSRPTGRVVLSSNPP